MSERSARAVARATELLARGPQRDLGNDARQRLRAALRSLVLRTLRPYVAYQRQADEALLDAVAELDREIGSEAGPVSERFARLETVGQELVAAAESLRRRIEHVDQALHTELYALRRRIEHVDQALRTELYAVPYVADSPFEQFDSAVGEVTGYRSLGDAEHAGSSYAGFEDLFRGAAERVTELQRPYLPLVAHHQPVLDIGCGRGEFLALLASESIDARGVDSDPGMIERCREQGLPAQLGDGIEFLESLDDGSLGTVFCAQVVEHLPVAQLQRLLELARRKLAPEGLFIAETVNPHSLPALKTFWVDPTHQHPIFPEVALAMCGLAGFAPAYVFAPGHPSFNAARFKSNSYAVVARAPARDQP